MPHALHTYFLSSWATAERRRGLRLCSA